MGVGQIVADMGRVLLGHSSIDLHDRVVLLRLLVRHANCNKATLYHVACRWASVASKQYE